METNIKEEKKMRFCKIRSYLQKVFQKLIMVTSSTCEFLEVAKIE